MPELAIKIMLSQSGHVVMMSALTIICVFGLQAIILCVLLIYKRPRTLSHVFLSIIKTFLSEKINSPKYVRYAWGDNPDDVNLYNSAGLPTCPFRTDE